MNDSEFAVRVAADFQDFRGKSLAERRDMLLKRFNAYAPPPSVSAVRAVLDFAFDESELDAIIADNDVPEVVREAAELWRDTGKTF